ncbi:MAG: STAS domain-containing protein [Clostridia bacterium]|nr:STAS domain-containing protein [Clostridia bacterium]
MDVKTESAAYVTTVHLAGELDHHNAGPLRARVDEVIRMKRPKKLVLDFSGISFMDSSGIGFVMGRYKQMQSIGGELTVSGASPRMEKVMRLAGLERLPIWKTHGEEKNQ